MINITSLKSALFSVCIAIVLALAGYVIGLGDVFKIDWHAFVNVGVMAGLVGIVSLIKSWMTNSEGKALGVQVK